MKYCQLLHQWMHLKRVINEYVSGTERDNEHMISLTGGI